MRRTMVCLAAAWLAACGTAGPAAVTKPPEPAAAQLRAALRDAVFWGPDFEALLHSLGRFRAAGERQIVILSNQVVGRTKYATRAAAEAAAAAAAGAYRQEAPATARKIPALQALLFRDDRTYRVGTPPHDARYLAPGLRIDLVVQKYGKAERITEGILDDGTDKRPIFLTEYHYAGGALVFVTSDATDDPNVVDRVYLDIERAMHAII